MNFNINSPYVFYAISFAFVGYLLYTMIRRRKGERPGFEHSEPEL